MPRDNDKNNGRPPRRERGEGAGRKGGSGPRGSRPERSSGSRDGDKKFGDRKFGDKKPYAARGANEKPYGRKQKDFRKDGDRLSRPHFDRDERPSRGDRPDRGSQEKFGSRNRDEAPRRDRDDSRSTRRPDSARFEKRSYSPRAERSDAPRPTRFNREDRPHRDDRPTRHRAPDRGPRKDFNRGESRGGDKPWEKREPSRDRAREFGRQRDGGRDRPQFSRPRQDKPERSFADNRRPRNFDRPREDRPDRDRPKFGRPRFDKPRDDRAPRGRSDWQEHPRSERRDERPRRDNEDDSKIFAKRAAFGGRGEYREPKPDFDKRVQRSAPPKKKSGERIAKIVARAGMCSRRDAEEWIVQGRVAVNGRAINSPALDVTSNDSITIDGKPLPERERTRLFLYHKPRGLMTTHSDPEGRPTVFDRLPDHLPRLISIGRLDFNTEGLLLLTNDGGLARSLELPDTGWLRRYRVRAHGDVTQAQLDELKKGVEVDGVKYGSIDATLEHDKSANVWIVFAIREGKNREVRNVMAHLGLEVNRLIRISYGPFQLGELEEGQVEEVKTRVLREQLGEKIVAYSGAQFGAPVRDMPDEDGAGPAKGRIKPAGKRALIADRKGRRILVTRAGSDEARTRNEDEASGYGPPRRPTRSYKGKRDLRPRED
ncbi:MAG: pseudouridine synthase [Afipia sp.]|nr:pseudouridine synthase [Afipia sp.]